MEIGSVFFKNPEAFWLLLLLPGLVFWHWRSLTKQKFTIKFPALHIAKKAQKSWMLYVRRWLVILRWAGLVLLIVALARPQSREHTEKTSTEGVDIMLVLDVSGSMNFLDMLSTTEKAKLGMMNADKMYRSGEFKKYTRLGYAKRVIEDFILRRPDDRLGLSVFASTAYTQCPLTTDHGVLVDILRAVNDSTIDGSSTAIGDGLMDALLRLRDSKVESKVVVLLTDGANNAGQIQPERAADVARALGIKVYTIGMGKNSGSFMWFQQNPFTGELSWTDMPIPPGESVDEELLQQMAELTGGQFYRAHNAKQLEEIYATIDQLEKTEIQSWSYTRYGEKFPPWLLWGAILVLIEVLLMNTRFTRVP
ncbi:MAG: VWA domain-containing protein [Fibrobacter sp.]|nr:VWA domain-containing protein [Fibrobacter sp.]